jgi:hypothetical protein
VDNPLFLKKKIKDQSHGPEELGSQLLYNQMSPLSYVSLKQSAVIIYVNLYNKITI